jgi:hypothetical protein
MQKKQNACRFKRVHADFAACHAEKLRAQAENSAQPRAI